MRHALPLLQVIHLENQLAANVAKSLILSKNEGNPTYRISAPLYDFAFDAVPFTESMDTLLFVF